MTVAGAILAGGRARRLEGRPKGLIEIAGRTIMERLRETLSPQVAELCIVANEPAPYAGLGVPIIADNMPGCGPLAGIEAALSWSPQPHLMVVACDMPFLSTEVVALLTAHLAPGVDCVVPVVGGLPEPLVSLYARTCLPRVKERLRRGQLKVADLATDPQLSCAIVTESELRAVDPTLRSLVNINSSADLAAIGT